MTIENLISRNQQSSQINDYVLHQFNLVNHCQLVDGLHCRSFSPTTNIHIETSLLHGEISRAIQQKTVDITEEEPNNTQLQKNGNFFLKSSETKEHKSVKSEQNILDRLDHNLIPYNSVQGIPRNQLFGINTRSIIKYS
jgi:hypothetical protein